jgi:hypothetical protein
MAIPSAVREATHAVAWVSAGIACDGDRVTEFLELSDEHGQWPCSLIARMAASGKFSSARNRIDQAGSG